MAKGSCQSGPHRVALLVDHGSNPFEIGCVCEIFGASRQGDLGPG